MLPSGIVPILYLIMSLKTVGIPFSLALIFLASFLCVSLFLPFFLLSCWAPPPSKISFYLTLICECLHARMYMHHVRA